MITILVGIILVIMLIILAFLIIPFHISLFFSKKDNSLKGKFRVKWIGITLFTRKIPSEDKKEKEEKPKEEKKQKWDLERIQKVLNLSIDSWPHLERVIKSLIASIKIEKFSFSLILGLESPVDTALITGYIWAFLASTKYLMPLDISVTPDLDKSVLDVSLDMVIKITFIKIIVEIIRAYTKKPVRTLINELRG